MDDLVSALKHIIYRDLLYVIGGISVISSFLYLFQLEPKWDLPTLVYLFPIGIGYTIGYMIQDGMSIIGIVTTRLLTEPCPLLRWVYRRFTDQEWTKLEGFDAGKARMEFLEKSSERAMAEYQRIVVLKQIGSTMGSCLIVSFVLLSVKAYCTGSPFDISLAVAGLASGATFVTLDWLKAAQEANYLYLWSRSFMKEMEPLPDGRNPNGGL